MESETTTAGAETSNGPRVIAGVSRGRSTESNEPEKLDGLTTREGLNLAGSHDHRWSCSGSVEADWLSYRQRSPWQRKSAASFRKDCQEPPDADPHVRWCGSRGGQSSRRPDWVSFGCELTKPIGGCNSAVHEKIAASDECTIRPHEQRTHCTHLVRCAGTPTGQSSIIRLYPGPRGTVNSSRASGVMMMPGLIVLTRAPRLPYRTASAMTRSELPRLESW